jgi:hypothetical protein
MGVKNVIKLNTSVEGSDAGSGLLVREFPITLAQQIDPFTPPSQGYLLQIVTNIVPNTFVHCGSDKRTRSWIDEKFNCQGGQDRTGLVIGIYRVKVDRWSKEVARNEMKVHGFHPELLGLERAWVDFND